MPLFLHRFLAWTIIGHKLKAMETISYTCECTHGEQDTDFEFVMVVGLGRGTSRHVPGTGFWNDASTLKQHFVLHKNGSKYYLKYTFLVFPVLGIFGFGTSLGTSVL